MRLPRVRFTIGRAMAAVAVLALIMGGARIAWLRDRYRKAAAYYAAMENLQRTIQRSTVESAAAEEELLLAFDQKVSADDKQQAAAEAKAMQPLIDYYAALKRKYERAAARPWLPVDPDPPPP
jgi:hypothetical protein